jgi:hypothetical protein
MSIQLPNSSQSDNARSWQNPNNNERSAPNEYRDAGSLNYRYDNRGGRDGENLNRRVDRFYKDHQGYSGNRNSTDHRFHGGNQNNGRGYSDAGEIDRHRYNYVLDSDLRRRDRSNSRVDHRDSRVDSDNRSFEENKAINKLISSAHGYSNILEICQKNFNKLNEVNIATAFHRIAKDRLSSSDLQNNPTFIRLKEKAIARIADFDSQGLANLAWAFATLKIKNEALFDQIAAMGTSAKLERFRV